MAGAVIGEDAEARRMGGGRSIGRQSSTATQQSQATPPSQSLQQSQAANAQKAAPAPTPAPATAAPRNRWLGPIAGLAAGLGIAALLSHFGLGGAFAGALANIIMIAVIAMVILMVLRWFMNRRKGGMTGFAGAGAPFGGAAARGSIEPSYVPPSSASYGPPTGSLSCVPQVSVPAGFDTDAFLRNAKVYFVRLQDAWDRGDSNDIREFTTPEMFAEVKLDIDARGSQPNRTDVVQLNADMLGVEDTGTESLASVRFNGLIRETQGAAAEPFVEVWNLSKQKYGNEGWLLAGIQQVS
jgi:predicted lipid-binding transport protein (Tim44 family)